MSRETPNLVDREATGGAHAKAGFAYQSGFATAKIPAWLRQDGFSELLCEGAGDVEAKTFVPGSGLVRDFYECKNHDVSAPEFFDELDRFARLDAHDATIYSSFTLVCTGFHRQLDPLRNAVMKVKGAARFYDGSCAIVRSSLREIESRIEELRKDAALARLLVDKVSLIQHPSSDATRSFNDFRPEIETTYSALRGAATPTLRTIYNALSALLDDYRSRVLPRSVIEDVITSAAGLNVTKEQVVRIFTAANPAFDPTASAPISFAWHDFSGEMRSGQREYPPSAAWDKTIVGELSRTRDWIASANRPRHLVLEGQRRISAGVAIGAVFSATQGFNITMSMRGHMLRTDDHADMPYTWIVSHMSTDRPCSDLAVSIGIGQDPSTEVRNFLNDRMPVVAFVGGSALTSAKDVNAAVWAAKQKILKCVSELGSTRTHLFLAVPAQFAIFLGHRLNACGLIQCYEHTATNQYAPTCLLQLA